MIRNYTTNYTILTILHQYNYPGLLHGTKLELSIFIVSINDIFIGKSSLELVDI